MSTSHHLQFAQGKLRYRCASQGTCIATAQELLSFNLDFFWAEGELYAEGRGYGVDPQFPSCSQSPGWQDPLADLSRNGAACLSKDSLRINPRDSG